MRDKELDQGKPEEIAESYLDAAALKAGLLEERGPDIFAFWHPTFEEYLAAVKLTTPTSRAKENLLKLRDDPRWREVILLACGYVSNINNDRETVTEIVGALAQPDSHPLEPLLHQHLRLAAACLEDKIRVKQSIVERIIGELAGVVQRQPYELLTEAFIEAVRSVPRHCPSSAMVEVIKPLAKHEDREVQMESARLFSNAVNDNETARAICEQLFDDKEEYYDVRCHAALGLLRAGDYRDEVWKALIHIVTSDFTHLENALEELSALPSQAFNWLHSSLTANNPRRQVEAAKLLKELGQADERVIEALRSLLTAVAPVRASKLLKELVQADKLVVKLVRSVLTFDELSLRVEAPKLLKELGQADEQVIEMLRSCLTADAPRLRVEASKLLVEMAEDDESVVQQMAKIIHPQPWAVLAACQRIVGGQELSRNDCEALAEITRVSDDDTEEQGAARQFLFEWAQRKLEGEKRKEE